MNTDTNTTVSNQMEVAAIADFTSYFGNEPKEVRVDGEFVYADGFYCVIKGKSIRKRHGIAWRRND